jgi:hypothetical protein
MSSLCTATATPAAATAAAAFSTSWLRALGSPSAQSAPSTTAYPYSPAAAVTHASAETEPKVGCLVLTGECHQARGGVAQPDVAQRAERIQTRSRFLLYFLLYFCIARGGSCLRQRIDASVITHSAFLWRALHVNHSRSRKLSLQLCNASARSFKLLAGRVQLLLQLLHTHLRQGFRVLILKV